jgi:hypothetical protein
LFIAHCSLAGIMATNWSANSPCAMARTTKPLTGFLDDRAQPRQ